MMIRKSILIAMAAAFLITCSKLGAFPPWGNSAENAWPSESTAVTPDAEQDESVSFLPPTPLSRQPGSVIPGAKPEIPPAAENMSPRIHSIANVPYGSSVFPRCDCGDPNALRSYQPCTVKVEPVTPRSACNARIVIDVATQTLTLYLDGAAHKQYQVAVGKPRTPTPLGKWKVKHKGLEWGGGFGSRWLGLDVPWGIYGIHGTNKPWTIGTRVSGGCVRMNNRDVEELFDLVGIGTPVEIIDSAKGTPKEQRRDIMDGDRGSDVFQVETILQKLGFLDAEPDGIFDLKTKKAVIDFQKDQHLPVTGIVDEATMKRLTGKETVKTVSSPPHM